MRKEPLCKMLIPNYKSTPYNSIIQVNENFYTTKLNSCYIYKLDKDGNFLKEIQTDRNYFKLCFDYKENCIWAITLEEEQNIYKLDENFNEVCKIKIKVNQPIYNISYDCHSDNFYITTETSIFIVNKKGETKNSIKTQCDIKEFLDCFKIEDSLYIGLMNNNNETIVVKLDRRNKDACHMYIDSNIQLCKLMILKCKEGFKVSAFGIIDRQSNVIICLDEYHGDSYGYHKCNCLDRCVDEEYNCSNGCDNGKYNCLNSYENEIFDDILGYCDKNQDYDNGCNSESNTCKCKNNNCKCEGNYRDCCNKTVEQSITDIIESVALIETALAHIINAEGEKIQKALCVTDDICVINKTNESVTKLISKITFLEQVLVEKLEIACKIQENNKKRRY